MSEKIVVLGSCMIDFVSYSSRLPNKGETLKGTRFITNQGGKGANQCMAAAKLGANTSLIARLGDDHFGKEYINILKSYNIDTAHTYLTKNFPCGIAQIMVSESTGDNCIVIIPGANDALTINDWVQSSEKWNQAKILVCQLETPLEVTLEALKQFKGISILNGAPAIANLCSEFLKLSTILCVNETEAATISGLSCNNITEAKEVVAQFLKIGCNSVILTLGDKGALVGTNIDSILHVETSRVVPVDTTGAGDCFIGSLAYLIAEYPQFTLEKQVEIACKLASYSVQSMGTHTAFADSGILKEILQLE